MSYDNEIEKEADSKIITHKEAVSMRLNRYFTGLPCVQGHKSERHTNSGKCIECVRKVSKGIKSVKAPADKGFRDKKKKAKVRNTFEKASYATDYGFQYKFTARLTKEQHDKVKQQRSPSEYIRGLIDMDMLSTGTKQNNANHQAGLDAVTNNKEE